MKRVIILQIVLLASVAAAATDPNLVGWWKFDEGNGTTAYDSAGGNNGILINGPAWTTGQIGGGLSFDGTNDYVNVSNNSALAFSQSSSFSIAMWVYPVSSSDLLCKMRTGGRRNSFGYELQYNSVYKNFNFSTENSGVSYTNAETPLNSVPPGNWYFVTAVYDNRSMKIYLNGQLGNTATFPGGTTSNPDHSLTIGVRSYDSTLESYFNGTLDDIRIYNRALSAEEIQQLYNPAAVDSNDSDLVGWWKFDDGNGTTATDSAGGNNGTLINGPTWTTGKFGGGLRFDGINDYVEVPNNASLSPGYITLSAWVKPDIQSIGMTFIAKSNYNDSSSEQYVLGYHSGIPSSAIKRNSSCAIGLGWKEVSSTQPLTVGQWSLVTSTWDGSVFKIYVNGELTNSDSNVPAGFIDSCSGGTLRFGIWWKKDLGAFKGVMDDVRIYNRALSAEEIQQLYTGEEVNEPITLASLEITGPGEVAEDSSASYKAIVHYSDGSTKDVTALAKWCAEPNIVAAIDAGQLTTSQALYPKHKVKVYAKYTEELITVDANLPVSVLAICPQGNALKFDGVNDYVDVADSASLRFTQNSSFSICLWVNPSSTGYFLSKMRGQGQHNVFGYRASWNSGMNCFSFVIDQSYIMNTIISTPLGSAPAGSWYHVAYVYDKKNMKIFLDGQLSATGVFTGSTGNTSPDKNLALGTSSVDSILEMFFGGTLDDVHIYNRVLSANEIQAIMHIKSIGSDPNLVAYWDFDAGSGQTVADVSGHGNNGILGSSAGIDAADPCWVESEAPVGLCTTEQVMLRDLLGATDDKEAASQLITDAKAKERASVQLITELQKQMNNKDLMNAYRAKVQICVAVMQEEMVSRQIDATIKRLDDALQLLNYEVDSNSVPPIPWQWQWFDGKRDKAPQILPLYLDSRPGVKK